MKDDNGITNERLEEIIKLSVSPPIIELAKALLAERAELEAMKDVWKDAPEWAVETYRIWKSSDWKMNTGLISKRTLPKSRARIIAERLAHEQFAMIGHIPSVQEKQEAIKENESALLEYGDEK